MINLTEELYAKLLTITDNVHFSVLPEDVNANELNIAFDVYETSSFNTLDSNNYANRVDLTVKILHPDTLHLLQVGEQVKEALLATTFAYSKDVTFKNSVPIFPDYDLRTQQLTLIFDIYYDQSVTNLIDGTGVSYPVTKLTVDTVLTDDSHNVVEARVIKNYVDTQIAELAGAEHTHEEYALKTDIDNIDLSSKADVDHLHDNRYYTQQEVNNLITAVVTNIDWQGSVDTFSDLTIAYPLNVVKAGFTVTVNDTGEDYRYNGSTWVSIGNNSVPMATALMDGRMSKSHYSTVANLSTTHYTRNESDTKFLNVSNFTSGILNDNRLSTNVPLKNVVNTFTGNLKVKATLEADDFIVDSKDGVIELGGGRFAGAVSIPIASTTHLGQLETPWLSLGFCQNFLRYTEDFTQSSAGNWIRTNITSVTANTHNTPRNVSLLSDSIVGNAVNANLTQTVSTALTGISAVGWWTFSVFLKTISGTANVGLQIDSSSENGSMKYVEVSETWQRYSVNQLFASTNTFKRVILQVGANTVVAWGAQLEPYSYANVYSGVRTTTQLTVETPISRIDASTTISGSLTTTSSIVSSSALTSSRSSTTLARVDGLVLQAASSAASTVPERTAPAISFLSRYWDGALSKILYWSIETTPTAASASSVLKFGYRQQDTVDYTYPVVMTHNSIDFYNEVEIKDINKGVIMTSPDGSRWRMQVNNDGTLRTTKL